MRFAAFGHEIDYETHGEGRPIVLVHGLTVDRHILVEACEPAFAHAPGWRRIYPDLPGHGRSPSSTFHHGADELVGLLAAFVREVAPGAALLGYSYAGYIVLGLLRELDGVPGAMLVCPVVEPEIPLRVVPAPPSAVDLPFNDDSERQMFSEVAVVRTQAALDAYRRVVLPAHRTVDRAVVTSVRNRYVMSVPYGGALELFDRPLAIVCGRQDFWVGYVDALRLVRTAPRGEMTVLPGCGHLLPLEQAERFQRVLADFVARIS